MHKRYPNWTHSCSSAIFQLTDNCQLIFKYITAQNSHIPVSPTHNTYSNSMKSPKLALVNPTHIIYLCLSLQRTCSRTGLHHFVWKPYVASILRLHLYQCLSLRVQFFLTLKLTFTQVNTGSDLGIKVLLINNNTVKKSILLLHGALCHKDSVLVSTALSYLNLTSSFTLEFCSESWHFCLGLRSPAWPCQADQLPPKAGKSWASRAAGFGFPADGGADICLCDGNPKARQQLGRVVTWNE